MYTQTLLEIENRKKKYLDIQEKLKDVAENLLTKTYGYKVIAIYLQGSQNYNVDTETSDFDMKAVIMPTFEDIYFSKKTSTKYTTKYGEVEVKDIRLFANLIIKANPTYLELLTTMHAVIYDEDFIFPDNFATQIISANPLQYLEAMCGTAKQKYEHLLKASEGTQHILDKFGYQPKELHHLVRMFFLISDTIVNKNAFEDSISYEVGSHRHALLLSLKRGFLTRESAITLADSYNRLIDEIRTKAKENFKNTIINELQYSNLHDRIIKVFKKNLISALDKRDGDET